MTQQPLILLVDDEPILADSLVQILEGEGFRAASAGDGASAVRIAEQVHPDLVICDVILPGTSGIEAAKQIRRALPSIPILLFSGQAAANDMIEAAQFEGYHFEVLAKPVRPEFLISIIRERLSAAGVSRSSRL